MGHIVMGYLKVLTSLKLYFQVASYCTTGGDSLFGYSVIANQLNFGYYIGSPCIRG